MLAVGVHLNGVVLPASVNHLWHLVLQHGAVAIVCLVDDAEARNDAEGNLVAARHLSHRILSF